MFARYGPVSDVYIPVDYYSRRCRGFAYVQYPCDSLSWAALLSYCKCIGRNEVMHCMILMYWLKSPMIIHC